MYSLEAAEEIKRDEIIAEVISANTQERCLKAEALMVGWMKDHPNDFGMLDAGEQLAMMSERYDLAADESARRSADFTAGKSK